MARAMSLRQAASMVFLLAAILPILLLVYLLSESDLLWHTRVSFLTHASDRPK